MAIGICDRRCLGNKLPRTPTTRRHQTKSWNCQLLTHLLTTGSIDSPTHPVLLQQNIWTCTWMSNPPNPSNDSRNYPLWDQRISKVILVYSFISNHQKNPNTKATRELSFVLENQVCNSTMNWGVRRCSSHKATNSTETLLFRWNKLCLILFRTAIGSMCEYFTLSIFTSM